MRCCICAVRLGICRRRLRNLLGLREAPKDVSGQMFGSSCWSRCRQISAHMQDLMSTMRQTMPPWDIRGESPDNRKSKNWFSTQARSRSLSASLGSNASLVRPTQRSPRTRFPDDYVPSSMSSCETALLSPHAGYAPAFAVSLFSTAQLHENLNTRRFLTAARCPCFGFLP